MTNTTDRVVCACGVDVVGCYHDDDAARIDDTTMVVGLRKRVLAAALKLSRGDRAVLTASCGDT